MPSEAFDQYVASLEEQREVMLKFDELPKEASLKGANFVLVTVGILRDHFGSPPVRAQVEWAAGTAVKNGIRVNTGLEYNGAPKTFFNGALYAFIGDLMGSGLVETSPDGLSVTDAGDKVLAELFSSQAVTDS